MKISNYVLNKIKRIEIACKGEDLRIAVSDCLAGIQNSKNSGFKASSLMGKSGPKKVSDFVTTTRIVKLFEDPNTFIRYPERFAKKAVKSAFYDDWVGDLNQTKKYLNTLKISK